VGESTYPFKFVLPPSIPTSYQNKRTTFGQIQFTLDGTIDIPWGFNVIFSRSFTVIINLDLNLLGPGIRQPYALEVSKIFCCWCCASEPATYSIPKGVYLEELFYLMQ